MTGYLFFFFLVSFIGVAKVGVGVGWVGCVSYVKSQCCTDIVMIPLAVLMDGGHKGKGNVGVWCTQMLF